ncbi:type IV secretion system protein [Paraburkholderia sp. Tr-20389]|nr:type IV secretion system protein [Paraburkholderia sp. Tr-20389]
MSMSMFLMRVSRRLVFVLCALLPAFVSSTAFADTTGTTGTTTAQPLTSQNGDFTKGSTDAINQITSLIGNLIPAAVDASANVMTEANKFAWGLGVISLVLVGIRFSGTHHPVAAWVNLFEEVAVLGIFVALYLGYSTSATGFWTWFDQLASHISGGADNSISTQLATLAGTMYDALKNRVLSIKLLTDITGTMVDAIGLLLAFIVILIASIVFAYFSAVGQIQAAVGIVLGPIAISLGFSSYTRNYFMRWLDWMIHSGMYVVMVAVLVKLVGANIANAVSKATPASGATVTGAYAFDLAVFVLLLAFEIPKLAGMFGSGAGATGTGALKLAKSFIP